MILHFLLGKSTDSNYLGIIIALLVIVFTSIIDQTTSIVALASATTIASTSGGLTVDTQEPNSDRLTSINQQQQQQQQQQIDGSYIIEFVGKPGSQEAAQNLYDFRHEMIISGIQYTEEFVYRNVFNGVSIRLLGPPTKDHSQSLQLQFLQHQGPENLSVVRNSGSDGSGGGGGFDKIQETYLRLILEQLSFVKDVWPVENLAVTKPLPISGSSSSRNGPKNDYKSNRYKSPSPSQQTKEQQQQQQQQQQNRQQRFLVEEAIQLLMENSNNYNNTDFTTDTTLEGLKKKIGLSRSQGHHQQNYRYISPDSTYLPKDIHKYTGIDILHTKYGLTGKGIKVGVVDFGVDYTNPEFGNCYKTPGCLIQYGYDFVGNIGYKQRDIQDPASSSTIHEDENPYDNCEGHGTHVAGIIAGQGNPSIFGVAPNVTLGVYKIGNCYMKTVPNNIIVAGMERAFKDGMDIINVSMVSNGWREGPTAIAAEYINTHGVMVIASAGNEGDKGLFTTRMPAIGKGVISVGSYDAPYECYNTVKLHFVGNSSSNNSNKRQQLEEDESNTRTVRIFNSDSNSPFEFPNPVEIVILSQGQDESTIGARKASSNANQLLNTGCSSFTGAEASAIKGKIVVLSDGYCSYSTKAHNSIKAGAAGVLLSCVNGESFAITVKDESSLPFVGIEEHDALGIATAITQGKGRVTLSTDKGMLVVPGRYGGQVSGFSSWGPEPELDISVNVLGPGGGILSTFPLDMGKYEIMWGTSMAAPYITGTMALLYEYRRRESLLDTVSTLRDIAITHTVPANLDMDPNYYINPLKQGAGAIVPEQILNANILVTPSSLPLNYSVYESPTNRELTINNLDFKKTFDIKFSHLPSESVSSFDKNGKFTPSLIKDINGSAKVVLNKGSIRLPPRTRTTIKVQISPPEHLDENGKWFYGGYIHLDATDASTSAKNNNGSSNSDNNHGGSEVIEQLNIPYMGFKGDYKQYPYFPTEPQQQNELSPVLTLNDGITRVMQNHSYIINRNKFLVLSIPNGGILRPTRVRKVELVDSKTNKTLGYLSYGYNEYTSYSPASIFSNNKYSTASTIKYNNGGGGGVSNSNADHLHQHLIINTDPASDDNDDDDDQSTIPSSSNPPSNSNKPPMFSTKVNNWIFKDKHFLRWNLIKAGKDTLYKVRVSALKIFGNPNSILDYDIWESVDFNIMSATL
ncbi:hypothetical protein H4219_004407 [Mycoemilia scoparia]|uniref:Peptidase S8/S53 domain-containing protein n=1 Tax=Mycoemilia scoparia TaxID=417184 RepID=A0A9W8DR72_9FUNG|nr:hypothetical protein H4219_004407 [Mycoemilia scoparia]